MRPAPGALLVHGKDETITQLTFPEGSFEFVFGDIFAEALDLLIERQRKYGPRNIADQGLYGVFQRITNDKISRLRMALNGRVVNGEIELDEIPEYVDESFEDTLLDVANYALIMLALKRGLWGKPLADDL